MTLTSFNHVYVDDVIHKICNVNMGVQKQIVAARLDEILIMELKKIAEEENRNLSNVIETIIKKYLKEKATKEKQ